MDTKQILRIIYFTKTGELLGKRISTDNSYFFIECKSKDCSVSDFVRESFELNIPFVFIGATGIAVRSIAPFLRDKLTDIPVIVVDELGQNVIPILSGHYGGGNDIAILLAKHLKANAIITTASDVNGIFAIDVFARKNGLIINNKDYIKGVNERLLENKSVTINIDTNVTESSKINLPNNINLETGSEDYQVTISDNDNSLLTLIPKRLVLGIGCKKNKSFEELLDFVTREFSMDYLRKNLFAIASIDVKADELGLIKLASFFSAKFIVYSAGQLSELVGDYSDSDFVMDTVGVSNVCERAAVLAAGLGKRKLVLEKKAGNGITLAAAKRDTIDLHW